MPSNTDANRNAEKVVHNFFTPASQKPPEAVQWNIHDGTLLCGQYDVEVNGEVKGGSAAERPAKIAAFDFVSHTI